MKKKALVTPTTFHARKNYVEATIHITETTTVGVCFVSPEHILEFMSQAMSEASKVWPDSPYIKEYLSL